MENNKSDVLDGETDGFITPTDNADRKTTDLNHKRGFNRGEILSRRLFEGSPLSRGMITLRKINLVKVFSDEFLMGEILESYLAFKGTVCDTVSMPDSAMVDSESTICLASGNKIQDLREHSAPKEHLQNEESDSDVVVNMASLSVSKQAPAFELSNKPDACRGDARRGMSGSFIQIPTARRESANGALPNEQCDSAVSSRSVKLKKGKKFGRNNNTEKTVSPKKHDNLTLQSSDLPQVIGAEMNYVSSTEASKGKNKTLNNKRNKRIDSLKQLLDNAPVEPAVQKGLKHKRAAPTKHLQNEESDSDVVVNMASLSVSKLIPFELANKPDNCTGDARRGLSGSLIQVPTVRKESANGALPEELCDSVVSSRSVKLKKGKKFGRNNTEKTVLPKKHDNLTLQSSDLPQVIGAETNQVSSTFASKGKNKTLNNKRNKRIDSLEQLPGNAPVEPAVQKGLKHKHAAPTEHLQNKESDSDVNMASLSVSKPVPTFEVANKPDICRADARRGPSGSFIQKPTVRRASANSALNDKQCDSAVSSRTAKLKKGTNLKRHNDAEKTVSAKKQSNLTLKSLDLPQVIGAETNCVSPTEASEVINKTVNNRCGDRTDPSKQLPDNISLFKIPTARKQLKHAGKQAPQEPDKKVSTKEQYSCGNTSMLSFGDSSFSPVEFILPPESPHETSVKAAEMVQCVTSEVCGHTELMHAQNHCKAQSKKRKIKNAKANVDGVRSKEESSNEIGVRQTRGRQKTRSAVKHSVQNCHTEEHTKECADTSSQIDTLDVVRSRKMSHSIKAAGKLTEGEKKNIPDNTSEKTLETSAVIIEQSKHILTENTLIMNMCSEEMQCLEAQTSTDGKTVTRTRRGVLKNQPPGDVRKETNVAIRRSLIAKRVDQHVTKGQSLDLEANSSLKSLANEPLPSAGVQSDGKLDSRTLLKSGRASDDAGVSRLRNRNSLTKPSKPEQSFRSSLPMLNGGDKRPNSTLSRRSGLGEQCMPSEDKHQAELKSHFNPKSSLSDSNYRNRSKKAVSAVTHKQKETLMEVPENLKVNKLQEVCYIGVYDQENSQVVESSSDAKMPPRELRKRKINVNLTENAVDKSSEISVPDTTHVKTVKPTKRTTKVTTESLQEKPAQILETAKKQKAKKNSHPEVRASNEQPSKVKKETVRRKLSEAATNAVPAEKSSKKDKAPARKKPTKMKSVTETKQSEVTRSDARPSSQKFIGAHCSAAGGVSNAVFEAVSMGARAFALFVRNGRTWKLNPLDVAEAEKFKEACKVHGFLPRHILPHGSYLLNCGSSNVDTLQKSRDTLVHELQICELLGLEMYNFHPGSACGKGSVDECLVTVADSINLAHEKTKYVKTVIENMSCQGQTVGGKFEELKTIIDHVKDKSRIGVCLDTCHAFAAGFDLSSEEGFNKCIESFDKIIGLHYLCALHLNDSKGQLGCCLDRHENIGKGHIGLEGFRCVMNDPRLNNIPMILETPVNDYAKEIRLLCDLENV